MWLCCFLTFHIGNKFLKILEKQCVKCGNTCWNSYFEGWSILFTVNTQRWKVSVEAVHQTSEQKSKTNQHVTRKRKNDKHEQLFVRQTSLWLLNVYKNNKMTLCRHLSIICHYYYVFIYPCIHYPSLLLCIYLSIYPLSIIIFMCQFIHLSIIDHYYRAPITLCIVTSVTDVWSLRK